jgi:hypothetical protein
MLDLFLRAAALWADEIIISDQMSDDGSREIASRHPKVHLLRYESAAFHEADHRRFLIDGARRLFPGSKVLVALDADELLTATVFESAAWQSAIRAPGGTLIQLDWLNVYPGFKSAWRAWRTPCVVVDDGAKYALQSLVHCARVPMRDNAPVIRVEDVQIIHYQYVDWARMHSKHCWYQCFERMRHPTKSPIDLYREYHHMYAVSRRDRGRLPPSALRGYATRGVDPMGVTFERHYRWDGAVLDYFDQVGTRRFARENIWDRDWIELARRLGRPNPDRYTDPRTWSERLVHLYLRWSQPFYRMRLTRAPHRLLRRWGW